MAQLLLLPNLDKAALQPTLDYLQDAAKVVGKLQQVFVPADPHDWDKGLQVTERGLASAVLGNTGLTAQLDFLAGQLSIGQQTWQLKDLSAPDLLAVLQQWASQHKAGAELARPEFSKSGGRLDSGQAGILSQTLWWFQQTFTVIGQPLRGGLLSPVLLFPHHFDLSLAWYPFGDERQISLGFSFGDETIPEPYLYLTAYPEPAGLEQRSLPSPAFWQRKGFSGAVLRYADVRAHADPPAVVASYVETFLEPDASIFS
jgi:hypothetical protein